MIGLDGGPMGSGIASALIDRVGLSGLLAPVTAGSKTGQVGAGGRPSVTVGQAEEGDLAAYRALRRQVFVQEQGLFDSDERDEFDEEPTTVVLVARDVTGVVGGVRVAPHRGDPGTGWWFGSRLVVTPERRGTTAIGQALVRAACALVEEGGALRFDASVQLAAEGFFSRLGWTKVGLCEVAGEPHVAMRWPIDRVARLVQATKEPLAAILAGMGPGGPGWVGDDGAPVAGSDLVAACDAILPAMVERDPDWAGWCGVLVNVNDLAAMGATPVAVLDAVGAPTAEAAARIVGGLRRAADAYGVAVIGGHTQVGVPASLSVTALGRTATPVAGGGGRPGDVVRVTADLGGGWRPGYRGRQWDSTTSRTSLELRHLTGTVTRLAPTAAKDVSMAGIVGTLGMLAEASGCGAELDVADVPRPPEVSLGDWLTCFPGFAMITTEDPVAAPGPPSPGLTNPAASARCGRLVPGAGVTLVWPDGSRTGALEGAVTGLGPATG
jgi:putative N-acetyltransferase (TIGR04045 family)